MAAGTSQDLPYTEAYINFTQRKTCICFRKRLELQGSRLASSHLSTATAPDFDISDAGQSTIA